MYSFFQQKVKNAEAMALKKKKYGEQQEALSVQLQGDPSSFLRFVSFFFLSHMFPNTVLMSCGAAFVKSHSF